MVKLSEIMRKSCEEQEEFMARTYWDMAHYNRSKHKVSVYKTQADRDNPTVAPIENISVDAALRRLEQMNECVEHRPLASYPALAEKEADKQVIGVIHESIEGKQIKQQWINSVNGEVVHSITNKEVPKWQ
jgi:hypothetical protein